MQRAAVCVIVPVWGAEKTLHRCVDSILCQQAEGGVCCVLVDDGSPDRCGAICDEYAAKDSRVTAWWEEFMPMQGAPSMDDRILGRESPLKEGGPDRNHRRGHAEYQPGA